MDEWGGGEAEDESRRIYIIWCTAYIISTANNKTVLVISCLDLRKRTDGVGQSAREAAEKTKRKIGSVKCKSLILLLSLHSRVKLYRESRTLNHIALL